MSVSVRVTIRGEVVIVSVLSVRVSASVGSVLVLVRGSVLVLV